ncbi:MAG: FecR domain-containing protein [Armatimonadetes bacterium]|nr:FecR domain-containing protein [Armatimonadota bacterium]
MLLLGGRKKAKPKSEDELLSDALVDLAGDLDRKERRRKRRYHKFLLPAWLDRRVFIGLAIILVVLVADGVRRENQEFSATLTDFGGQVLVAPSEGAQGVPAQTNQQLGDNNVLLTGQNSYASLEYPDGSVTNLGPNAQLVIKLLEYSRGGRWRSRALMLKAGQVWSSVGPNFGAQSEMKVYTPSAVAAVRGTIYAVRYEPDKRTTAVTCTDGFVQVEGFTGTPTYVAQGGMSTVSYGRPPKAPEWMSDEERAMFQAQASLFRPIPPELWLKTVELTITQTLDAPLSILGIGKSSWARGAADIARRTAAQEQLRRIMQMLEGYPRYPPFVNPITLEELNVPYDEASRMLKAFHGNAIQKYEVGPGGRSYRMIVQARDKRRTTYELTPTGIRKLESQ